MRVVFGAIAISAAVFFAGLRRTRDTDQEHGFRGRLDARQDDRPRAALPVRAAALERLVQTAHMPGSLVNSVRIVCCFGARGAAIHLPKIRATPMEEG